MTTPTPPAPDLRLLKLNSGELIVALCTFDAEHGIVHMQEPFELVQHFTNPVAVPNIGLIRYMMFATDDIVRIPFTQVQSVTTPRQAICRYYLSQVQDYTNHTTTAIDQRLERALSDVVPPPNTSTEVREAMIERQEYEGPLQ